MQRPSTACPVRICGWKEVNLRTKMKVFVFYLLFIFREKSVPKLDSFDRNSNDAFRPAEQPAQRASYIIFPVPTDRYPGLSRPTMSRLSHHWTPPPVATPARSGPSAKKHPSSDRDAGGADEDDSTRGKSGKSSNKKRRTVTTNTDGTHASTATRSTDAGRGDRPRPQRPRTSESTSSTKIADRSAPSSVY